MSSQSCAFLKTMEEETNGTCSILRALFPRQCKQTVFIEFELRISTATAQKPCGANSGEEAVGEERRPF